MSSWFPVEVLNINLHWNLIEFDGKTAGWISAVGIFLRNICSRFPENYWRNFSGSVFSKWNAEKIFAIVSEGNIALITLWVSAKFL